MSSSCIITDNAAQFTRIDFPESISLRFIDLKTEFVSSPSKDPHKIKNKTFPKHLPINQSPIVFMPDANETIDMLETSFKKFDDVYILLHSLSFNPIYPIIKDTLSKIRGRACVHLIDSQSISIGQGYLIQSVIELIQKNLDGNEIEKKMREKVPHIYTLLCTPGLSFLHNFGIVDAGQSVVGEMISLLPIFSLENGQFSPVDKIRNVHGVIDYFIEYVDEFEDILQVSFIQCTPPLIQESKRLRQALEENHPDTVFTEHPHNNYLSSIIGAKGFGIVVIEDTNE